MISEPVAFLAAGALVASVALCTARDGDGGAAQSDTTTVTSPLDGASLFQAKGCTTCHIGPGISSMTGVAPDLRGAAEWAGTRIPGTSATDYLRQSIRDPQAFIAVGGPDDFVQMPTLPLAPEELDALVAYLLDAATT